MKGKHFTGYALAVIISLIFVLGACSAAGPVDNVEGKSFDIREDDFEYTISFEKDGKVQIIYDEKETVLGNYVQTGESIKIELDGYGYECIYDGKNLAIISEGYFGEEKGKVGEKDTGADDVLQFEHDGTLREYVLHLVDDYEKAPLVFVLHGFGGDVTRTDSYMRFSETGEEKGFVVCYPQALSGSEKDGTYWNANWGVDGDADDIGFLASLAEFLVAQYGLDEEQVYVCGYSNGGFMSYTLALNASDTFKKAAVISGLMSGYDWSNKENAAPVPILHIHGALDDVIPIDGDGNYHITVGEIVEFWRSVNGCTQVLEERIDADITGYKYVGGDCDVWYYRIENMGHEILSKDENGFDTRDLIWEFFDS